MDALFLLLLVPHICGMYKANAYKEKLVASVLANVYVKLKYNHPILNFQAMCHTTGNSITWYTPFIQRLLIWWLHTEKRGMICCTGWGSGSTGHCCLGLKMTGFSRQVNTGTNWMFISQPKPQDSETFGTDTVALTFLHYCWQMATWKWSILFDIHNSFLSALANTECTTPSPTRSVTFHPIATVGCNYN